MAIQPREFGSSVEHVFAVWMLDGAATSCCLGIIGAATGLGLSMAVPDSDTAIPAGACFTSGLDIAIDEEVAIGGADCDLYRSGKTAKGTLICAGTRHLASTIIHNRYRQ